MGARLTLPEINELSEAEFVQRFGGVFEHSPWVAERAAPHRPWRSLQQIHGAMCAVVDSATPDAQLALIRSHPDLVGKAALAGTLTRESTGEQLAAGLDPLALTPQDVATFTRLNDAYKDRFGFPFVICARENKKEAILAGFASRLANDREIEIAIALGEIDRIAWYRLADMIQERDTPPITATGGRGRPQMRFEITYGKSRVPVYRTKAKPLSDIAAIPESPFTGRANALLAEEIDVEVYGDDFLPAYTEGDNSMVVATDSMKNFVIRETLAFEGATLEGLCHFLGKRFASEYEQLHDVRITGREIPFHAVPVPGANGFGPDNNLFSSARADYGEATVLLHRDAQGAVTISDHACHRRDIHLMKLTGSAFTAFVRDGYTTLPDRRDRPLYTFMEVGWKYSNPDDLIDPTHRRFVPSEQVRDICATVFAEFVSESIQQLLYVQGERILERFPQLSEVWFTATNRTRDPYGESESGAKVYSDPFPAFGNITLKMSR